ncbi:hypothetical protein C8Q72DRAFT_543485 [Fomitopsis betulina]|nr:hypothetical protein C8Q72DRAFT_543485 [Fomitopsis betulina]
MFVPHLGSCSRTALMPISPRSSSIPEEAISQCCSSARVMKQHNVNQPVSHPERPSVPNNEHLGPLSTSFSGLSISQPLVQEAPSAFPPTPEALPKPDLVRPNIRPSDMSFVIDCFQDLSVAQEMPQTDLSQLLYGFGEINISQPMPDNELSSLLDSFQRVSCQDPVYTSAYGSDDSNTAVSPLCSPEEAQSVIASLQALLQHRPDLATDMLTKCPDAFPSINSAYWRQLLSQTAN